MKTLGFKTLALKTIGPVAALAATLTFASIGMASPSADHAVAADCKKVTKKVAPVCKSYNAHKAALENLRNQLHKDDLSIKAVRAHTLAVEGVFKSIRAKNSKTSVRNKIKKLKSTAGAVQKQVNPLAMRWRNYRDLKNKMESTRSTFEKAYKAWLKGGSSSSDDKINCKKVAKNVRKVCRTFKSHRKALNEMRKQLKSDELTGKHVRAHVKALKSLYKAVASNKSLKVVRGKEKALERTGKAVLKQVEPLAQKWDNYRELFEKMITSKVDFEKALKSWKKKKSSSDNDDNDDWDDL